MTAEGATCVKTGTITIVNPPAISLIKNALPPFKIVVTGSNLQSGIKVYIDGCGNGLSLSGRTWERSSSMGP